MKEPRPYAENVIEFCTTVSEEEDEFIFKHLQKYCDGVSSITGITHVPKKLLIRAIECFKGEHKEEFNFIMNRDEAETIKKPHWIYLGYKEEWWGDYYQCSVCKSSMIGRTNYCPDCGVKMED